MTGLKDMPLDLLQETSTALSLYVRARRKAKLRKERGLLARELQDTQANLAEIQALFAGVGEPTTEENDHA